MPLQLIAIALATLVSEDLTCIAAGVLVARGTLDFLPATLACLSGIFGGDLLLFAAGRFLSPHTLGRMVSPASLEHASGWFTKRGMMVTFLSRFTPGMRLPAYVAAGLLKADWRRFALWLLLAGAVWTPLLVGLAAVVGEQALRAVLDSAAVSIFAVVCVFALLSVLRRLAEFRTRRALVGRLKRAVTWEFWPVWLAYLPVFPYLLWLAVRFRSASVFTMANPGMPLGGLAGESKSRILDQLRRSGRVPAYTVVSTREVAEEFMLRTGTEFPVVLKPDVGERGRNVAIIRSAKELAGYFEETRRDTIIQRYVEGPEFGVFYYRRPNEERGRIFAITEKRFPAVVGDGRSTVAELILRDPRAVCLAPLYMKSVRRCPDEVPRAGEEVPLAEVGAHCRGTIFLDGGYHRTDALEEAIDQVSKTHRGFYFGRYDVRAASAEAFRAGEFQVIELNGVSAEATHIYDPALSIWEAYRVLFRQWRIAFEIGAANRALR